MINQCSTNHEHVGELFYKAVNSYCPCYHHILDVGCGYGIATRYIRRMCHKMTLIDVSASAIRYQRDFWHHDHDVEIYCCTIELLEGYYDLIYYFLSLHHINDIKSELVKTRKLLAEDGELIICEIASVHDTPFHQNDIVPFDGFSPEQLSDIITQNGFRISRQEIIAKLNKNGLSYDIILFICKANSSKTTNIY